VVWHYYGCEQVVAFSVIVEAVLEDGVAGFWGKLESVGFAECYEYCSSCFLVVGEIPVVFRISCRGRWA
jgi:hypothetical protein